MTILYWIIAIVAFAIGVVMYDVIGFALANALEHYDGLLTEKNQTRKDQIISFFLYPMDLWFHFENYHHIHSSPSEMEVKKEVWRIMWPFRIVLSFLGIACVSITLCIVFIGRGINLITQKIYRGFHLKI